MIQAIIGMSKENGPRQSEEALTKFVEVLAIEINRQLRQYGEFANRYGITLSVDYHPDMTLSACADFAGVSNTMLDWPCKTVMWVKPDEVSVRYGYRAETQIIWPAQPDQVDQTMDASTLSES